MCQSMKKNFFDVPVKNKEEAYEKVMSISKNNDYTTGNLLDYHPCIPSEPTNQVCQSPPIVGQQDIIDVKMSKWVL